MPEIQDLILASGSAIFGLLLLPTLLDSKARVPIATSLTTGLLLALEAGVFLSLGLLFTSVTTGFAAAAWLLVACYRRSGRASRSSSVESKHFTQ